MAGGCSAVPLLGDLELLRAHKRVHVRAIRPLCGAHHSCVSVAVTLIGSTVRTLSNV